MTNKYSGGRGKLHFYYQCTRNTHGEKDIHRIEAEINIAETQILNAHVMVNTLKNFSQIIDGTTEKEKKELLPLLIESVTFTPKEIKIALYDHFTEERFVNQSENDALELSNWLRW